MKLLTSKSSDHQVNQQLKSMVHSDLDSFYLISLIIIKSATDLTGQQKGHIWIIIC